MKLGRLFFAIALGTAFFAVSAPFVKVNPEDTGVALENPGMGWVFHHFDNSIKAYGPPLGEAYAGEGWPGLTVAYLRLAWSYLEPEDGVYDWTLVDTVAQRYFRAGRKIAFRFTCFETGIPFATPEWLKDAGVPGRWFRYGKGVVSGPEVPGAVWEPDYDNPLFLNRLERFLMAAAVRYDGHPGVAFIDIGSIGVWGEGNPCTRGYPAAMYKTHIDIHTKCFKKTLLVGMDDWRPRFTPERKGRYESSFMVVDEEELRGRTLHVRAGIWLPHYEGDDMPEKRFLPAFATADRRVQLGELTVAEDGTMMFQPAKFPGKVGEEVDFILRFRNCKTMKHGVSLTVEWELLHDFPPGAMIFCHVGDAEKDVRQNCRSTSDVLDYAFRQGTTLRDDSIIYKKGIRFSNAHLASEFWPDRPVVIESGHYAANDWSDGADQDYFDAIEAYHASYVSIHGPLPLMWKKHQAIIEKMSRRLGYRLQLAEARWEPRGVCGRSLKISTNWRNAGVAPCYPDGNPIYTLKSSKGDISAVWSQEDFRMRQLSPAAPGEAQTAVSEGEFRIPKSLASGEYDLFVSVGDRDGTPRIALPLAGGDGELRYHLGKLKLRVDAEYRLHWSPPTQIDGEWCLPVTFEILKPLPAKQLHAFGHLEVDGEIVSGLHSKMEVAFEGAVKPGKYRGCYSLRAPQESGETTYKLYLGLWFLKGRRILPEAGTVGHRVYLGEIRFSTDGTPRLLPVKN